MLRRNCRRLRRGCCRILTSSSYSSPSCDYNGFPVIGIATRAGTLIAGAAKGSRVSVLHTDCACGSASFSPSGGDVVEDSKDSGWARYVAWGWAGMIGSLRRSAQIEYPCLGAVVMVDGNLPRAAGLASSSSLVTASVIMAASLRGECPGREELALIAAEGERVGAGTRGGAVDHTVSMCGVQATALHVSFSPKLKTTRMAVPASATFVVVHSGVHAFKGQNDAMKALFNARVIECRVGAAIAARRLNMPSASIISTPGQLREAMISYVDAALTLPDICERVTAVLGSEEDISISQAASELDLDSKSPEWKKRFYLGAEFDCNSLLRIGCRLTHVFGEASRVERFHSILQRSSQVDSQTVPVSPGAVDASVIEELGGILNDSHTSLRYMYECSIPEVDGLVKFCIGSGAAGSRIIGAGWGGCTLSLVSDEKLDSFLSALRGRRGDDAVFVAKPCQGARVLMIE